MKITQARRYVIIGAISDISIVYRASICAYEVHLFIHSDYPGKISASGTALKAICGTVKVWDDLGSAYAYVRNLGWKQLVTISKID